jgi:FkbM family methyltransferase
LSSSTWHIAKNGNHFEVISNPKTGWLWYEIFNNNWEEATFKIFDRFLSPEHAYLDIGAWIGPTVLYGAHRARHVYGIEPDPVAYAELMTNLSLNPSLAHRITCIHAALADKPGTANLYIRYEFGDSTSSLIPTLSDKNYCQVRSITIHELIAEHVIQHLNFIKMDIEGGEYSLIPTLHEFLKAQRPTLYLSLHPHFLSEHVNLQSANDHISTNQPHIQTEQLLDSLQFYKYIYDINGNVVDRDAVLSVTKTGEFVFSDEIW